jgi:hypothetical protein
LKIWKGLDGMRWTYDDRYPSLLYVYISQPYLARREIKASRRQYPPSYLLNITKLSRALGSMEKSKP